MTNFLNNFFPISDADLSNADILSAQIEQVHGRYRIICRLSILVFNEGITPEHKTFLFNSKIIY